MVLGWGHRLASAAIWMYSGLFVFLAFQPTSAWMDLDQTWQFALMLGLAFGLGSVPYILVRTGHGQSNWAQETRDDQSEQRANQPGPRRVA